MYFLGPKSRFRLEGNRKVPRKTNTIQVFVVRDRVSKGSLCKKGRGVMLELCSKLLYSVICSYCFSDYWNRDVFTLILIVSEHISAFLFYVVFLL